MTEERPGVFDETTITDVATEHEIAETAIVAGLGAVQVVVSGFGDLSVDDLVYDWRTRHHKDPLVDRTPDAYYLDVREHVWTDVVDRSDIESSSVATAVKAVHAVQFSTDRAREAPDGAMVLART